MTTNLIYALRDSRNDAYFYVGKTTAGIKRPLNHLKKSHNKEVNSRVKLLNDLNQKVFIDVLETDIDLENLSEREKHWINYYSEIYELCNVKDFYSEREKTLIDIQNIDTEETKKMLFLLKNISNIVSNKRKYLGITQSNLASESNLNRSTITQIEKGETTTIQSLIKVLEVLSNSKIKKQKIRLK
jgi:DNA-binding XRE family transcriptional regulator